MKPLHKGILGFLALSAAGLGAWTAVAHRSVAAESEGKPAAQHGGLPEAGGEDSAPGQTAPPEKNNASRVDTAPRAEDRSVPVPAGLQVAVKTTARGRELSLSHRGHIVALRSAGERRAGLNKVEWPAAPGAEKLVWETTDAKTLETVRGEIAWDEAAGKATLAGGVAPAVVTERTAASHTCRGMSDGGAGFVVVCRVDGQAAAASVETKDPKQGVWSQADSATLVRFDLPMNGEGVDAKVIGFEKGGKGTLVRVEASRVAGETTALLAIGEASRTQPHPFRRFVCRFPIIDDP